MMLPEIDSARTEAALDRFDADMRSSPEWQNWEGDESYKYALEKNGRRYPLRKSLPWRPGYRRARSVAAPKQTAIFVNTATRFRRYVCPQKAMYRPHCMICSSRAPPLLSSLGKPMMH